jgi:hypothetical protein
MLGESPEEPVRALALSLLIPAALIAQDKPAADVKVGTGVAKMEIEGEAKAFSVAPDTKIWVWTKVSGMADKGISVVFEKGGKAVFKQELKVARSPYRTHAYRTFRAADAGNWTAKVVGEDGAVLGSTEFTVEIKK